MPMYFLCADIGTSRMKIAITGRDGVVIESVSRDLAVIQVQEGYCEMDMAEVWSTFSSLCGELQVKQPHLWSSLKGVGVTGQGDGLWLVDKEGEPVRPAILWNDTRTKEMETSGLDDFCTGRAANIPFAGSFHMLLSWLKQNEKENFQKVSHIFHCKDWINFNLTGTPSGDYSDASLAGFDLFEKEFCQEIFDEMEVPEADLVLPSPVSTDTIVGRVNHRAHVQTGLPEELPVIAGSLDVCAVAHGVGVRSPGDTCVIVGTTLCTEVVIHQDQVDLQRGMVACHTVNDLYLSVMPTLSGTTSFDWAKKLLYPDHSYPELEEEIALIPVGSRGIIYHPYLYGERAPFRNPFARAGFYGLSAVHGRQEIMRSVYEGLALSLRDCLGTLPEAGEVLTVCGGGAVSDLLCSIIADCTGRTVRRSPWKEAGIKGIADILFQVLNEEENFPSRNKAIFPEETMFAPHTENSLKYDHLYESYEHLKNSMEGFWSER